MSDKKSTPSSNILLSWINCPKQSETVTPQQKAAGASPRAQNSRDLDDDESKNYFKQKEWWKTEKNIPKEERCTLPNCTYERSHHRVHFKPIKFLSLVEKKILVKYIIITNSFAKVKGILIYEKMRKEGYLTHRTAETLRNCYKRTIIRELQNYNLKPTHLQEFMKNEARK